MVSCVVCVRTETCTRHDCAVRAAYPGTFDPPTVAHLAIAEAARKQCDLERVDFIVNQRPLGKSGMRPLEARLAMLEAVVARRPWLGVVVTDHMHLADIAEGYDILVLGADKWAQVLDSSFYASEAARDAAVARLPRLAVAPRDGLAVPEGCVRLAVDLPHVSSSAARAGRGDLVLPEAAILLDMSSASTKVLEALYAGDQDGAEAAAEGNDLDVFAAAALGQVVRTEEELQRDPQLAHTTTSDGFTALHLAAFFGTAEVVAVLLERGADPTAVATNPMSVTPLHSAVAKHAAGSVRLLLGAGANADAQQAGGYTALHAAAMHGEDDIVDSLLAHAADPTIADDAGLTAADHAAQSGHAELAARLRGLGC